MFFLVSVLTGALDQMQRAAGNRSQSTAHCRSKQNAGSLSAKTLRPAFRISGFPWVFPGSV